MSGFDPNDFIALYPGVHTEKEKALAEKYLADNKAIEERGDIDVQALVNGMLPEDTPGLGPAFVVTEAMVRYNIEKYDPENPVLNDSEYARKLGYKDIIAMPCYGAHDDTFMVPYPPDARDTLLVSQLNHSITSYRPIYPGDTLYLVSNSRHVTDHTPTEGSIYRTITLRSEGSIYNQRGEKVNDVVFRVTESVKIFKEGKRPTKMDDVDTAAIDTADIHRQAESRAILIDFLGRDIAVRHISNWMGDHGWIYNIHWGIMPAEAHRALGKDVPVNPDAEYFLEKVPHIKGTHVLAHGLTGDLALVKSYVYDKYFRYGNPFVELAWWTETIEGDIWLAGGATVGLPSRRAS